MNVCNRLPPLEIALVGDSLSTDFSAGSIPHMLWRARRVGDHNWFRDTQGNIDSIYARLKRRTPVTALHFARVGARVDPVGSQTEFMNRLGGIIPCSGQLERLLTRPRLPEVILFWIGHNNLDWVRRAGAKKSEAEILQALAAETKINYQGHIARLLARADKDKGGVSIVIFGLINFTAFFNARRIMEGIRQKSPREYPYLEAGFGTFPSMRPQHRDRMIELAEMVNRDLAVMVEDFQKRRATNPTVRLAYSGAFSEVELNEPEFYSKRDAWHPSVLGHQALAEAAWKSLQPHLPFRPLELSLRPTRWVG